VDFAREEPSAWKKICAVLVALVEAAAPFLQDQSHSNNFVHIGCDFMADESGDVWLLECNLPPCLGSQTSSCQSSETAVARLVQPQLEALVATLVLPKLSIEQPALGAVSRWHCARQASNSCLCDKGWQARADAWQQHRATAMQQQRSVLPSATKAEAHHVPWNRVLSFATEADDSTLGEAHEPPDKGSLQCAAKGSKRGHQDCDNELVAAKHNKHL